MSDLAELGLSSYEAKVYRALVGLGPATASEVAAASEVPKGRIYDVLNSLNARELLVVHESSAPTRYVAADPADAVDVLLAERKRDLAEQREHYEELAASISADLAPVVPARSRFWPAALGSDAALSLIDQQFEVADDRMLSVVSAPYDDVSPEQYRREITAIEERLRPDLDVRWLVSERLHERVPTEETTAMLQNVDSLDVRVMENLHLTVDVVDGETVFVHVTDPFGADDRLGVIGVRDETFAGQIAAAFDDAWAAAKPITGPD